MASIASSNEIQLREEVLGIIPKELSALSAIDRFEDVRTRFKDKLIGKQNQETLYLGYFTKDNDVTLGFSEGKFSYALVKLPDDKNKAFFERVMSSMSQAEKNKLAKKIKSGGGHHFGKEFEIELPKQALRLKFKNNEEKTLRSVLFWNKGAKAP